MESHSSSAASSCKFQPAFSFFSLFLFKIVEGGGRKGSGREKVCLKEAQRSLKAAEQWQRSAETGISWNAQKNWQRRKARATVWAAKILKRTSSYAEVGNIPGIHWFKIWPETIPKKIPVDERWWTADSAKSAVGQKIQVPVRSPTRPPSLNLLSATARKANPFTSLGVSTHSKEVLFFLLWRQLRDPAQGPQELPCRNCTKILSAATCTCLLCLFPNAPLAWPIWLYGDFFRIAIGSHCAFMKM